MPESATDGPPIFIVGVHRSGTTLLRYMLNSSPRIYIPPESDFIPRFFGRYPDHPLTEKQVDSLLATIFTRYRFVGEWRGERPEAAAFLAAMADRSPAAFLDTLYSQYTEQNGAVRWGDKTPIYASYVDLLARLFPQAQFVHIIRDGRDVALSMLEKWGQKEWHIDLYFTARNWVRRIRQARASGARLGAARYYELRYEALTQDPAGQLKPLCQFLGEPYLPEMAEPDRLGRARIEPGAFHAAVRQPPNTARVGRWQREMTPADLWLFQRVAGQLLMELGYPWAAVGRPAGFAGGGRWLALRAKYEVLQGGRRVLQTFGLMPPI
ncbi:MAG: sulfotransferase [Chloroflexota bacterium]